jgi:predicted metal-dependent hydrolase
VLEEIDYSIRRSDRARRVRVVVEPTGAIEVVLPRRAAQREAAAAVAELRPWIERRLAEAGALRERLAGRGGTLPFLGEDLVLRPERSRTRVHRRGGELLVPGADPRPAIERWYRRMARDEVVPLLDEAVDALGVDYASVRIANQRTRWGSCSTTGAMSFNWRLLLGPFEIFEYVVWHEACHLVHMDHSRRFWSLLEHHLPDYRTPRRWLKDNGATLVLG